MAHLTNNHHQEKELANGSDHYDTKHHSDSENGWQQDGYVEEFTPAEQKAIIHRIDRRLVVTTGFMVSTPITHFWTSN